MKVTKSEPKQLSFYDLNVGDCFQIAGQAGVIYVKQKEFRAQATATSDDVYNSTVIASTADDIGRFEYFHEPRLVQRVKLEQVVYRELK